MSDTASLELGKELWELSGWDTHESFAKLNDELVSQYSAGYLLRKLPVTFTRGVEALPLIIMPRRKFWYAFYGEQYTDEIFLSIADTPEDCLAKLCIGMYKEGILPISRRGL